MTAEAVFLNKGWLMAGSKRFSWDEFVDKVFWTILLAVIAYGVSELKSATESINDLNTKVSVVITEIGDQSKKTEALENRVLFLERTAIRRHDADSR